MTKQISMKIGLVKSGWEKKLIAIVCVFVHLNLSVSKSLSFQYQSMIQNSMLSSNMQPQCVVIT